MLLAVVSYQRGHAVSFGAVVIPDRSPVGRSTRIRCNLSEAEKDMEGA